ncbi:hypothetical protein [Knoellia aerolata]|uniref:Uncharacterized protein n=1 Tax=Knoellia aerolata DSM 18566 TaxID=1385519 RepID=A0A0A0JV37_9MICO|nr:hypothetical protein [Knoellia aerolata]KGN41008.1 hypothetical protein N801_10010 [Knoellia aerolata DSM 18566]
MNTTTAADLEAGLRRWAAGSYPDEAAVELLIRTGWTRRAGFINDCIHPLEGRAGSWIDWERVEQIIVGERDSPVLAASSGELRVLRVAHSLAYGLLAGTVTGLDRAHLDLVLAAIAHAGGSHQHNGPLTPDPDGRWTNPETSQRMSLPVLGSVHPWQVNQTRPS